MTKKKFIAMLYGCILASVSIVGAAAESTDMSILTYPIGLVTGEHAIDVDLGASGEPAVLYLDGEQVCSMSERSTQCRVDFGEAPHVHLLELVRTDSSGEVTGHASRWVNRPGQEAELVIQLEPRKANGICEGKALWSHPSKRNPVLLQVTENGRPLLIHQDGRSFAFPCPDAEEPHILAAAAIFPDGARAEAVTVSGGFGGVTEAGLSAVALTAEGTGDDPCGAVTSGLGDDIKVADNSGFEVVFVLDPTAGYRTLMASGWSKGMMPTTNSTTKQFDTLVQQGSKGSEAKAKNSWKRAESSLIDAEKMWLVLSNEDLQRANGFSQGKMNWLLLLFNYGSAKIDGKPRIADAVAASGLVAAAGPWRRAVVLVLGNHPDRDGSGFTVEQARTYLAEVGVPLFVLRNGKERDDGWPEGVPVRSMEAMADALEAVKAEISRQCIAWFPGDVHLREIAASLPEGISLSGRTGKQFQDVASAWQRADVAPAVAGAAAGELGETPSGKPAGSARIEVTAVNVLISARDADGKPVVDLEPDEVQVLEDGRPVQVLGIQRLPGATAPAVAKTTSMEPAAPAVAENAPTEPAAPATPPPSSPEMPVAVYVDRGLSSSAELQTAVSAIAERAEWLTSLGPVDVVVADPNVTTLLAGSTDAAAVEEALSSLASRPGGQHAIASVRNRFIRDIRKTPNRFSSDLNDVDERDASPVAQLQDGKRVQQFERSQVLTAARASVFEEDALLRNSMMRVSDWALANPIEGPRLLLVVGAGFDEDPVDFYLPFVEAMETQNAAGVRDELKRYGQADRVEQTGRNLAAAGWMVVPVATLNVGTSAANAEMGGGDRFQRFLSANQGAAGTFSTGSVLINPIATQRHLAAPSGGDVAMGAGGLDDLMASSSGWYRLSYQIDRPPDGANHAISVTSNRPDISIRTTSIIASETDEGAASARVRRLLRGSQEAGDLQVQLDVSDVRPAEEKQLTAEATVTVDLTAIAALQMEGARRNLRLSIGILPEGQAPFVMHRVESVDGVVAQWKYSVPLEWPEGGAQLAVVVEDLGSGAWGGTVTQLR